MKTYHIPIFVPHEGCPHDCVFCNQRKITGKSEGVSAKEVTKIIEENLNTMNSDAKIEIAFFGGSFTGIDLEKQTELLNAAYPYVKSGKVSGIRCSTRADYITEPILCNLKKYGVTTIELGVQSTDDEVLRLARRGHSFGDVKRAAELIKKSGINLGLQMMLGLPGDSEEKMLRTAADLIALKPECVRIYPTLVVEDTALCHMYRKGTYTPLSLECTVDILAKIIPMFLGEGIKIIRVGLQTTDAINEHTVKGPYHPAIRELAEGRIIRNILESHIVGTSNINVRTNPKNVSKIAGHKGCNRKYIKEKYGIHLNILEDSRVKVSQLIINHELSDIF